ncbi:Cysteine proteinases protein [Dioscorea alata]|uniref:Cysteine proteinases protein n=1 Tax=Dioscorea alata TaxID=55571 RepID=A0ACB7WQS5_DIOAL|nr:Cysteine proteinases protein [Dioscorea alata]
MERVTRAMNEIVHEETSTTKNLHQCKKRRSQRLQSSRTLYSNDESMIDTDKFKFYFEHLWKNLTEEKRRSSICIDSLWFSMYKSKVTKEKVLKWIKMKKILKKKYVFIPIVCW